MKNNKLFNISFLSALFAAITFFFIPIALSSVYTYSYTAVGAFRKPGDCDWYIRL